MRVSNPLPARAWTDVAAKRTIPVQILGHEYRIRSDADEDSIRRAAAMVDETMARVRDRTGTVDTQSVAVLAALNIADDYFRSLEESREFKRQVASKSRALLSELED